MSSSRRATRSSARLSRYAPYSSPSLVHIQKTYKHELLFSYPADKPYPISVTDYDLSKLDEGEFLNDTIVDFYLRYLREENPQDFQSTHIFSSFFYQSLVNRAAEIASNRLESGFEKVKKWTSKVDIFEKEFVVVHICESAHWYLGIIYNPKACLTRHVDIPDSPQSGPLVSSPSDEPTEIVDLDQESSAFEGPSTTLDQPPEEPSSSTRDPQERSTSSLGRSLRRGGTFYGVSKSTGEPISSKKPKEVNLWEQ